MARLDAKLIHSFIQGLKDVIEPPAFFYEKPYSDEYFSVIEAMLLDPHVRSQLELRKHAVLSADVSFEGDARAVEVVKKALSGINLYRDLMDMLSFLEFGWVVVEVVWEKKELWVVSALEKRPHEFFRFSSTGEIFLVKDGKTQKAPDYKFIYLVRNPTPENPYGESVLKPIYYAWKLKNLALAFWERHTERYAVPPLVALMDGDAPRDNLEKIAEKLLSLEASGAAALGGVKDLKPLEAKDKAEVFQTLIDLCNKEISKAITGQVLSSDPGDHGSYALAKVHKDSFLFIVKSDAKALEHKLNVTLIPWILELNGISGECRIVFSFKEDMPVDKLIALIDRGFPVSRTALYERYGVPRPRDESDAFVKPGLEFSDRSEKLKLNFSNPGDLFEGL